jgi:hypothetical protein
MCSHGIRRRGTDVSEKCILASMYGVVVITGVSRFPKLMRCRFDHGENSKFNGAIFVRW